MKLLTLQHELNKGNEPLVYVIDRHADVLHAGKVFEIYASNTRTILDIHPYVGYDPSNDSLRGTEISRAPEEYYRLDIARYRPSDCVGGFATHKLHGVPFVRSIAREETKTFQEYLRLAEQLKELVPTPGVEPGTSRALQQ